MHEVRKADFGIFAKRKARQGEETAALAVTGDESYLFPLEKKEKSPIR